MGLKLVEIQGLEEGSENFYLPYDKLVIACGSTNATHGVPGLEHCNQLKTISDAQMIRRKIMDNLERAALPSTDEEERKRLLSFVICGGVSTFSSRRSVSFFFSVSVFVTATLRHHIALELNSDFLHVAGTDWSRISVGIIRYGQRRCDGFHAETTAVRRIDLNHPESGSYPESVQREDLTIRRGTSQPYSMISERSLIPRSTGQVLPR